MTITASGPARPDAAPHSRCKKCEAGDRANLGGYRIYQHDAEADAASLY